MIDLLYITIGGLCILAEISHWCNTDNIIEKLAIAAIAIGCLVHLAHKPNHLIEIGLAIYLACIVFKSYVKNGEVYGRCKSTQV